MMGVAARLPQLSSRDLQLMKAAKVGWLRFGDFRFDQEAFLKGEPQGEDFLASKERVKNLKLAGFQLIGLTPGPREMHPSAGTPGSPEYMENYARTCAFFAEVFCEWIDWWQVANELDIWIFRKDLDMQQSAEFLKVGIRAMKEVVPSLKIGINITLFPSLPGEVDGNTEAHEGLTLTNAIYGDPGVQVDYAGFDSYPGTWRAGGVASWHEYLDGFHALTKKPIFVQEFGYASAGGLMSDVEVRNGAYPCEVRKWRFAWRGAHNKENQAEFLRESFRLFASKPYVLGAIYYNWRDATHCWQCREENCPAETSWGLLDQDGNPKPSYEAYKSVAHELCAEPIADKLPV